jgi:lipopolysaccharide export system protein LptA
MIIIKVFLFIIVITINIYATAKKQLTINAINFSAEDNKNLIIFNGDVKMNRIDDKLHSDKLIIKLKKVSKDDNSKEPVRYIATGNVYLEIKTTNRHYIAKGDKVIYKPKDNQYIILGNGYAEDKSDNRELYGDKIYINTITGEAKLDGSKKKPIRFIMELETKENR